jgi:hypothetical protein
MHPIVVPGLATGICIGTVYWRLPKPVQGVILLVGVLSPVLLGILPKSISDRFSEVLMFGNFALFGLMVGEGIGRLTAAGFKALRETRARNERIHAGEETPLSVGEANRKAEAWADWWAWPIGIATFLALQHFAVGPLQDYLFLSHTRVDDEGDIAYVNYWWKFLGTTTLIFNSIISILIARFVFHLVRPLAHAYGLRRYRVLELEQIRSLQSEVNRLSLEVEVSKRLRSRRSASSEDQDH